MCVMQTCRAIILLCGLQVQIININKMKERNALHKMSYTKLWKCTEIILALERYQLEYLYWIQNLMINVQIGTAKTFLY